MRGFVAPTDLGWYGFLLARPELSEVNFWRPAEAASSRCSRESRSSSSSQGAVQTRSGDSGYSRALRPLPVWRAWDIFEQQRHP